MFDLDLALQQDGVDPERIVEVFGKYMQADGKKVTRAMFEQNLAAKREDPLFTADITPLLADGWAWSTLRRSRSMRSAWQSTPID